MRLAVVSGLVTSACSLLTLVAYIAWPNPLVFVAINFILPKLYINSLLAMLNSRQSSMWSTPKGRLVDQNIIRFAPHITGSGMAESRQTTITIPGLSVTGTGTIHTNTTPSLLVKEGGFSSNIGDMSFA
ncbi:hypothetical protein DFS33DRAFT_971272 [Desarmillaria ectypa]|nr:hypothetical protein DFS33DRAFT_971272 [Desarmillaria ectypa]